MSRLSQLQLENESLSARRHLRNQRCNRSRTWVEHVFSHQVRAMGCTPIRMIGLLPGQVKVGLKNLVYDSQWVVYLTVFRRWKPA